MNELIECDCMDYMRKCADKQFDLAIVDPPYGGNDAIGLSDCKNKNKQATARKNYKQFRNQEPLPEYWKELFRVSKNQIIWGSNFYTKINLSGGRIIWNKHGTAFGEAEEAYCSMFKAIYIFDYTWNGMLQGDMRNKEIRIHPTQKPIALYKWLLSHYAHPGDKLFDSHSGSGSFRIAAYDMGFDLVSCELDHEYCVANEQRFRQHTQQHELIPIAEIQQLTFGENHA